MPLGACMWEAGIIVHLINSHQLSSSCLLAPLRPGSVGIAAFAHRPLCRLRAGRIGAEDLAMQVIMPTAHENHSLLRERCSLRIAIRHGGDDDTALWVHRRPDTLLVDVLSQFPLLRLRRPSLLRSPLVWTCAAFLTVGALCEPHWIAWTVACALPGISLLRS